MPYQLMNMRTGQYATRKQWGGFRWGGTGTVWNQRGHLINALNQGSLKKIMTSPDRDEIVVVEVELTPVADLELVDFLEGKDKPRVKRHRNHHEVEIPLED